jgi:hypothetical protein
MVARFEAMRQQRSMMWGVKAGKERKEGGNGKLVYRLPCPTVPMGAKRRSLVNKVAFKRERVLLSGELESKTGSEASGKTFQWDRRIGFACPRFSLCSE